MQRNGGIQHADYSRLDYVLLEHHWLGVDSVDAQLSGEHANAGTDHIAACQSVDGVYGARDMQRLYGRTQGRCARQRCRW